MVYKKEDRTGLVRHGLAKSIEDLEAVQKRSSSLDLEVKKGLSRILPELAPEAYCCEDYGEMVPKAQSDLVKGIPARL